MNEFGWAWRQTHELCRLYDGDGDDEEFKEEVGKLVEILESKDPRKPSTHILLAKLLC